MILDSVINTVFSDSWLVWFYNFGFLTFCGEKECVLLPAILWSAFFFLLVMSFCSRTLWYDTLRKIVTELEGGAELNFLLHTSHNYVYSFDDDSLLQSMLIST
jgi:hypothetical protein